MATTANIEMDFVNPYRELVAMRKNLVRLSAAVLTMAVTPAYASHFSMPPIDTKLIDNRIESLDPNIGAKILKAVEGMNLPSSAPIRLTINRSGKVVAVDFLDSQLDKTQTEKVKKVLANMSFGLLPFNARSSGSINLIFTVADLRGQARHPGQDGAADSVAGAHGDADSAATAAQPAAIDATAGGSSVKSDAPQPNSFNSEIKNLYTDFQYSRLDTATYSQNQSSFAGVYERLPLKSDESRKQEEILTKQGEALQQQGRLNASMMCFINASVYPLRMHDFQKAEVLIDRAVAIAQAGSGPNRLYLREAMLAYAEALLQFSSDNNLQGAEMCLNRIAKVPFESAGSSAKSDIDILKAQRKLYQRQQQTQQQIQIDKKIAAKCISMKPVEFNEAMQAYRDIETVAQNLGLTDETRDASQKCLSLIEEQYDINSVQLLPELANLVLIAEQNHYFEESKYLQKRISDVVDNYVQPVTTLNQSVRNSDAVNGANAVLNSLSRLQYAGGISIHTEAMDTLHRLVFKLKTKTNGCDISALQSFSAFLQSEGKSDEAADLLADACGYLEGSTDVNAKNSLRTARNMLQQALSRAGKSKEAAEIAIVIANAHKEEAAAQQAKDEAELTEMEKSPYPDYPRMAEIRIGIASTMRTDKDESGFAKQMPKIIALLEKIKLASPAVSYRATTGFAHVSLSSRLQSLMQVMMQSNQDLTADEQTFLVRAFGTVERQLPGSFDAGRVNIYRLWSRTGKSSAVEFKIVEAVLKIRQERDGMHASSLRPLYESLVRADQRTGELNQMVMHQKEILDIDRNNGSDPDIIAQDYLTSARACLQAGQNSEADRYFEAAQKLLKNDAGAATASTPASVTRNTGQVAITNLIAELGKTYAERNQTEKSDRFVRLAIARQSKAGSSAGYQFFMIEQAISRLVMNYTEANEQMKLIDLLNYAIESSEKSEGKNNLRAIQLKYKLTNAYLMASREPQAQGKAVDLMRSSEAEFDAIVQNLSDSTADTRNIAAVKGQLLQNYLRERLTALRNYGHEDEAKALEGKMHLEPARTPPTIGAPIMRFFGN